MRRVLLLAVGVLLVVLAGGRPVAAQTVTNDDLAAAALAVSDVPGYQFDSESLTPPPDGAVAAFARVFTASSDTSFALLVDALFVPDGSVSTDTLTAAVSAGALYTNILSTLNLASDNFAFTGPLHIGDADQSAVWQATAPDGGLLLSFYGDVFLQGRILGIIVYAAPRDSADPSQVTTYATLQDQKLLASALPADLVNTGAAASAPPPATPPPAASPPPALPSPAATTAATSGGPHSWYTSDAANATTYYCDDDPVWRTLSPRNVQVFSSVAALLAAFPGRRLHRPCLDGAIGP